MKRMIMPAKQASVAARHLYSELPDVVDPHVSGLLREAFLLYGKCGHRNHALYLDRASGTYGDIVTALAHVVRVVSSYRGVLAFITRRKDMHDLLSSSGLLKYVRVLHAADYYRLKAEAPIAFSSLTESKIQ